MTQKKWFKDNTISELKIICNDLGHFPSQKELSKLKKSGLIKVIRKYGGVYEFRRMLGYGYTMIPDSFWTNEIMIKELKEIILILGHFPIQKELRLLKKQSLLSAINNRGGLTKYRGLMGYKLMCKPWGYWKKEENIIKELTLIINKIGHFPVHEEIVGLVGNGLIVAINRHGGINKFRMMMGYKLFRKPIGHWTDGIICNTLNPIIKKIGHFPSQLELVSMGRQDMMHGIDDRGGILKFKCLCGYSVSSHKKELSKKISYSSKKGKKSEKLVKQIITDWSIKNNLPIPQYNVKLSKGNVIEFVCNTGKRIGIDVTNTLHKVVIRRKWTHQDYHKHLDELWIVVFSDVFTDNNYRLWNNISPDNVKVMSIHQFIEELDYFIDNNVGDKICKLEKCTFHTKEEFKSKYIHKLSGNITII